MSDNKKHPFPHLLPKGPLQMPKQHHSAQPPAPGFFSGPTLATSTPAPAPAPGGFVFPRAIANAVPTPNTAPTAASLAPAPGGFFVQATANAVPNTNATPTAPSPVPGGFFFQATANAGPTAASPEPGGFFFPPATANAGPTAASPAPGGFSFSQATAPANAIPTAVPRAPFGATQNTTAFGSTTPAPAGQFRSPDLQKALDNLSKKVARALMSVADECVAAVENASELEVARLIDTEQKKLAYLHEQGSLNLASDVAGQVVVFIHKLAQTATWIEKYAQIDPAQGNVCDAMSKATQDQLGGRMKNVSRHVKLLRKLTNGLETIETLGAERVMQPNNHHSIPINDFREAGKEVLLGELREVLVSANETFLYLVDGNGKSPIDKRAFSLVEIFLQTIPKFIEYLSGISVTYRLVTDFDKSSITWKE